VPDAQVPDASPPTLTRADRGPCHPVELINDFASATRCHATTASSMFFTSALAGGLGGNDI
jgi:hypothetical protein